MSKLDQLIINYPQLSVCKDDINKAFKLMLKSYTGGGKLLVCGNGGSASDSEHIVGELMKGFMLKRPISAALRQKIAAAAPADADFICANLQGALPAISLVSQSALISAYSNDVEPAMIFAQQVLGYGVEGDVLMGLSTSGNSKNVCHAASVAKAMGLSTIALTGQGGGRLREICDVTIAVPSGVTPSVQELHLPVYHTLCMMLEDEFFGNSPAEGEKCAE